MGLVELLFGFRGRIARSRFWLGQLCLLVANFVVYVIYGLSIVNRIQNGDATERADRHLLGGGQRSACNSQGNLIRWPGDFLSLHHTSGGWNWEDYRIAL